MEEKEESAGRKEKKDAENIAREKGGKERQLETKGLGNGGWRERRKQRNHMTYERGKEGK